ncbi:phage/plasmid primase, P4 family, partial [Candidatus Latescibacterota bacterium]
MENTLNLAESIPGIGVEETDFDQNPYLFNCKNGTYNFETGKLQPHNPTDNISKITDVEYVEEAECPYWLESLDVMFGGDADMIRFVQQAVGLSLTGLIYKELMFFCHGAGENGKSRFFDCIKMLLGDYFCKIPSEVLMKKDRAGHPRGYELARISGARFVVGSEIDENQEFDANMVKDMTGGDDINARFPHGRPFDFSPTHSLWLYGNKEPKVKSTDWGFWRRMHKIPFTVTIPKEFRKDKPEVDELYEKELPGILQWAIAGYLDFAECGLVVPKQVIRSTKKYRDASDVIKQFLKEECETTDKNAVSTIKEVYNRYCTWCDEGGEKKIPKISFDKDLEERGFKKFTVGANKLMWR